MSYSEIYTRRNWQNEPDTSTPLDADNLNAMDAALKIIDTRVVNIGNDAVYPSDIENALYGQPTIDQTTGIITFPKKGGGSYTLDTLLEKIVTNWTFDAATQSIILTLPDGSTQSIPLSSFITENEFIDTNSIAFTVTNHQVQAVVKDHSIGDQQMQTSYKAECEAARDDAEDSADASADSALDSEAWATGKRAGSDVPSTDPTYNNNSKYYSEQADALGQAQAENSEAWANGTRGGVDVPSTDPAYHNNAKYWKDQAQAVVSNTFAGLEDVDVSSPSNGQVPMYNSTTQMWENTTLNLDTDFVITYDATNYTPNKFPSEIKAAENAGKKLFVVTSTGYTIPLVQRQTSGTLGRWFFGGLYGSPTPYSAVVYLIEDSGDTWDTTGYSVSELHTGTLPVSKGGTGATTAADARTNLGLGSVATESTVPVGKGGTGATTLASGAALIGNGTGAVQTRAITNNTSISTTPTGSTNLATMNSLLYGMQNYNHRASSVDTANDNYTTIMARGIYATTTDLTAGTTALTNGVIALVYE